MLSVQLDGMHPMTTPEDNSMAEEIMKKDAKVRQLLADRYGITNMDLIAWDTW